MIVGLTGPIAAGKTTAARFLHGFLYYTYSDILRAEAKKRGIPETRENLQKLGTDLKKGNPGILSELILSQSKGKDVVADGIRTTDEIDALRKAGNAVIIGITADQEIRYKRLLLRQRKGDPSSFQEFLRIDNAENSGAREGQNIAACLSNR